jgi:predicted lipoprotein
MKTKRSRRGLRAIVALAIVAGALASLRPWTVVPIQSTPAGTFDPNGYVRSIWESRVLPTADRTAVEFQTFTQGMVGAVGTDGRTVRAVFVKGTARIAEVDRRSRVGLARLQPLRATDRQAVIQIGPVLRGTALRDALDFIRFTDFVNQLEFASVASALNERVISHVLDVLDIDALAGREVTFVGAAPSSAASTLEIVPVRLQVAGGSK